jgi:abhydrolase domain-containing protein 6
MKEKNFLTKKIKIIVILVSLFVVFISCAYFFSYQIERFFYKNKMDQLGMKTKKLYVKGNDYFEYAEGGSGETILLVHGFQSDKETYRHYIKHFLPNYNVIAVDLPGHGGSSLSKDQKFDIYSLANSISKFVDHKKIDRMHLIGSSTGGGICAIYAANNSEKMISLSLINPLGVDLDVKSDFLKKVDEGKNLFLPKTLKDLDELSYYLTGRAMRANFFKKLFILVRLNKKRSFFEKAYKELIKSKPINELLPSIMCNTLIIMGGEDRMLPPSSYNKFIEKIPNIQTCFIPDGTHVFVDNNLSMSIDAVDEFLKTNSNK